MKKTTNNEPNLRDVMESLTSLGDRVRILEKLVTSGFLRVNNELDTNLKRISVVDMTGHKVLAKLADIQDDLTCALGEVDNLSRKSLVHGQRITLLATQHETAVI